MERAGANDGFVSAWTDLGRNKDPTSSISGKKTKRKQDPHSGTTTLQFKVEEGGPKMRTGLPAGVIITLTQPGGDVAEYEKHFLEGCQMILRGLF